MVKLCKQLAKQLCTLCTYNESVIDLSIACYEKLAGKLLSMPAQGVRSGLRREVSEKVLAVLPGHIRSMPVLTIIYVVVRQLVRLFGRWGQLSGHPAGHPLSTVGCRTKPDEAVCRPSEKTSEN